MLSNESRMRLVGGVWSAVMAMVVAWSVAVGASLSTSALLLVICVAPMAFVRLIGFGAPPPPTVAEVLYAVNTQKEGR